MKKWKIADTSFKFAYYQKQNLQTIRNVMAECFYHYHLQNESERINWDKVFKNGPSKICGRQPLKFEVVWSGLGRPYHVKFFKGRLPQILLGPFLNTLSHISFLENVNNIKNNKNMNAKWGIFLNLLRKFQ